MSNTDTKMTKYIKYLNHRQDELCVLQAISQLIVESADRKFISNNFDTQIIFILSMFCKFLKFYRLNKNSKIFLKIMIDRKNNHNNVQP